MNRIVNWALPLLMIVAVAANGFAQQDIKWKDNKEYEDYTAVYNEKDLAKKATLAEKFFVDHKDAVPPALSNMYQMLYLSYANGSNWAKVIETYEKMGTMAPTLPDADKTRFLQIALLAASNLKNNPKTIEYANKILATNPNDLNALITLSNVLAQTLPTQDPAKSKQIAETLEITKRAIAQPKPGIPDAQWNPIKQQLHETACLMLLNQTKYTDSIAECQNALKVNSKDGYAWYLIGMSHKGELRPLIEKYQAALKNYNDNRDKDPITVEDLRAVFQGAEKIAEDKKNEAVDSFARSVAVGGSAAAEAQKELKLLFMGTPEELNKLIDEKKAQTGN
jgi:hypothetical protein